MADDLDSLKKKDLGQLLLDEIGYDQETVDWFETGNTAETLRTINRSDRAFEISTRLARQAGEKR